MPGCPDTNFLYHRNKLIWGSAAQEMLWNKSVMIFGLGGVGSFAVEALARSGVGSIALVDFDRITITNFNRQLLATFENYNTYKTDAMAQRIASMNPDIKVDLYPIFYNYSYNETLFKNSIDFVIDAIDSVPSKLDLIEYCVKNNINIISSMGTGNRLDPTALQIVDISETAGSRCPLTKKVRIMLKKRGVEKGLAVVASKELPVKPDHSSLPTEKDTTKEHPPGSSPFVPPVTGYILASYVVRHFLESSK